MTKGCPATESCRWGEPFLVPELQFVSLTLDVVFILPGFLQNLNKVKEDKTLGLHNLLTGCGICCCGGRGVGRQIPYRPGGLGFISQQGWDRNIGS